MKNFDYILNKNGEEILVDFEPHEVKKEIVTQFKDIRKEKKISQETLAKSAGMARPDVSRFESGNYNPSLELMLRYAQALGCRLKVELVPIDDEKEE